MDTVGMVVRPFEMTAILVVKTALTHQLPTLTRIGYGHTDNGKGQSKGDFRGIIQEDEVIAGNYLEVYV